MRKHKTDPMPFNFAILLLLIGILLGSIFTFGMQHWNAKVTREACTVVQTQFLSCDEIGLRYVKEIAIDCADGNRYFIDGTFVDDELRNKLSLISENEGITLCIHPNNNTIVEFLSSHGSLLTFEEAINGLDGEAAGFLFLGIFMYFCGLVGLYYVVFHLIRRKKHRTSRKTF